MRASRGEIRIEEILREAGLNFKMEYIFPDLKSPNGRPLRFDFVVFGDDGLIDFIALRSQLKIWWKKRFVSTIV